MDVAANQKPGQRKTLPAAIADDAIVARLRNAASDLARLNAGLFAFIQRGKTEKIDQLLQDNARYKREDMKAEHLRKSEGLLRKVEAERKRIIWEWKELQRFLEVQENLMSRRLEELDRDIVARRDEGAAGDPEKTRKSTRSSPSTRRTESWKDGVFPPLEIDFVELEQRIKHFAEKRIILQKVLLEFKNILRLELGSDASFLSGCQGRALFYSKCLHSCRRHGGDTVVLELSQEPVSFEEVAVQFSEGEWALLDPHQKALYRDVMQENYENVASLVLSLSKSDGISWEEEEAGIRIRQPRDAKEKNHREAASGTEHNGQSKMSKGHLLAENCGQDVPEEMSLRKVKEKEPPRCDGADTFRLPRRSERQQQSEQWTRQEKPVPSQSGCRDTGKANVPRRICQGRRQKSCTKCGKVFSQSILLLKHKRTHKRMKPHQCSDCGKIFSQRSHLNQHRRSHGKEKRFECSACGKTFHRRSHLTSHQGIHAGLRPYKCSDCGKSFLRAPDLRRHQKIHNGEKLHQCLDCGKSFLLNSSLIKHERIHTGEKPYKCPDCRKGFSQRTHLIVHKRTHTSDRPYKCLVCGSGFIQKAHLTSHQRTHTGEKPFKCSNCGKSFKLNSARMKHERGHGKKPLGAQAGRKHSTDTPPTFPHTEKSAQPSRYAQRVGKAAA